MTALWPSWEAHVQEHDLKGASGAPHPHGRTERTLFQDLPNPKVVHVWQDAEVARRAAESAMCSLNRLRAALVEVSGEDFGTRLRL